MKNACQVSTPVGLQTLLKVELLMAKSGGRFILSGGELSSTVREQCILTQEGHWSVVLRHSHSSECCILWVAHGSQKYVDYVLEYKPKLADVLEMTDMTISSH